MLAAIDGSIRSILGSILIGLAEVKAKTKSFIENWYTYIPLAQTIILAILSIILIKSRLAAIIVAIIAVVLVVLQILEFDHLKDNTYSPQFLRGLVKLTEYDLTLLNYEVSIWEQLKD
jgi:heme/copper-type cytochrome/quinol oxidase subunit 4